MDQGGTFGDLKGLFELADLISSRRSVTFGHQPGPGYNLFEDLMLPAGLCKLKAGRALEVNILKSESDRQLRSGSSSESGSGILHRLQAAETFGGDLRFRTSKGEHDEIKTV